MTILRDIKVPKSLLRDPAAFGGREDGDCLRGDLHLSSEGRHQMLVSQKTEAPRFVVPALTEAHCHLDKCHSASRMGAIGGDLRQAIEAQRQDKSNWTAEDLEQRMLRGLTDLRSAGCHRVRSHIDWSDSSDPPLGWRVLEGLAADQDDMTVQLAALTSIDALADDAFCNDVARAVGGTPGGVLGAFVLGHGQMDQGLANIFRAAERFGLPLDFHVDEGLGDWNGLEKICDAMRAARFEGPVLCGHAVSLIDRKEADLSRILDKLSQCGISICSLPTTNLYLQGRRNGTPDRRGLTRLRELAKAGVPIVVASDNVDDAFCPMGHHDPRAALHLASLAAHLDPPLAQWLPSISVNAERAMGVEPTYVDQAPADCLRICDVTTTADFIAGRAPLQSLQPGNSHMTQTLAGRDRI